LFDGYDEFPDDQQKDSLVADVLKHCGRIIYGGTEMECNEDSESAETVLGRVSLIGVRIIISS